MNMRFTFSLAMVFGLLATPSVAQEAGFTQAGNRWYVDGAALLQKRLAMRPVVTQAKNVILMIGDGMGPNTVYATRIFDGQAKGNSGEENVLAFEKFPYVAYSKTYNTNAQTPDSAGTASAIMTGVKTKAGVLSVTEKTRRGNCTDALANPVMSLGELAEAAGLATGVVTTTRLTHATPAAFYAHSAERNWENDSDLPPDAKGKCKDIAAQLIDFSFGDGIDVAMGGGRRNFTTIADIDPESIFKTGRRRDGRNLISEWKAKSPQHIVVQNQNEFDRIDVNSSPKVLGLFEASHMNYEALRAKDKAGEPSLAQMTQKAIEILSKKKDGYLLVVEGGRIDHASHSGIAYRTLSEAQAFNAAVATARKITNNNDTLIIVTADHGHTLALQGYAQRGNPILGVVKGLNRDGSLSTKPTLAADGKPYTVITFANGPGAELKRSDPGSVDTKDKEYRQQALILKRSETHGGQDTGIYASGPKAYLIGGVVEQNYIFQVIENALALKKRAGVR